MPVELDSSSARSQDELATQILNELSRIAKTSAEQGDLRTAKKLAQVKHELGVHFNFTRETAKYALKDDHPIVPLKGESHSFSPDDEWKFGLTAELDHKEGVEDLERRLAGRPLRDSDRTDSELLEIYIGSDRQFNPTELQKLGIPSDEPVVMKLLQWARDAKGVGSNVVADLLPEIASLIEQSNLKGTDQEVRPPHMAVKPPVVPHAQGQQTGIRSPWTPPRPSL